MTLHESVCKMLDDIVNELAPGIRPGCHFHFNLDSECALFNLQLMMDNPDFSTAKIPHKIPRPKSPAYLIEKYCCSSFIPLIVGV